MKRWLIIPAIFAVAGFAFSVSNFALAQDHSAVVKERLAIMKSVGGTLKRLGKSAKAGKVGSKDAASAAKALEGAKKFTKLFPAGSHSGMIKTRAKAEIWKDWAKFEQQAGKLVAALEGVQVATVAGDAGAMGKAVKAARGTCGGCHKPFRGPKPKK